MAKHAPPSPKYIEARWKGGKQTPTLIVVHSTVTPPKAGAAFAVAQWWQRTLTTKTSAHYVTDEQNTYQCVYDSVVAYHCGYNQNSLGLEMCDDPSLGMKRWNDKAHKDVLNNTADLAADLCLAYNIPIRFLTDEQLLKWGKTKKASDGGIVTHAQMSRVFKKSTHWDPGEWPATKFLNLVHDHASRKTKKKDKVNFTFSSGTIEGNPKSAKKGLKFYGASGLTASFGIRDKLGFLSDFKRVIGLGTKKKLSGPKQVSALTFNKLKFQKQNVSSRKTTKNNDTNRMVTTIFKDRLSKIRFAVIAFEIDWRGTTKDQRKQVRRAIRKRVRNFNKRGLPVIVALDTATKVNWFKKKFRTKKLGGAKMKRFDVFGNHVFLIDSKNFKWKVRKHTEYDLSGSIGSKLKLRLTKE